MKLSIFTSATSLECSIEYVKLYQHHYVHLILSYKHRLYHGPFRVLPTSPHLQVLSLRDSRWTFSCSELRCWLPIKQNLGFNHIPSSWFFLLSPPSRSGLFHPHVLVQPALGTSSNSRSFGVHMWTRSALFTNAGSWFLLV